MSEWDPIAAELFTRAYNGDLASRYVATRELLLHCLGPAGGPMPVSDWETPWEMSRAT
jgi:hypothetical protein